MAYCPFCSEALPKPVKVCPFCHKAIDTQLISSMYKAGETSDVDKKVKRKIWFREKILIILPTLTLLIGVIGGAIAMLIFMEVQYAASRSSYEEQIKSLQDEISNHEKSAANSNLALNNTIAEKDKIIASLTEQNSIFSRMVAFTSRLTRNSTITPNSPQDIDYFQRNIRYLQSLFNQEQEKLKETSYDSTATYNLTPIPQFLE
jgi:hypothetical protein